MLKDQERRNDVVEIATRWKKESAGIRHRPVMPACQGIDLLSRIEEKELMARDTRGLNPDIRRRLEKAVLEIFSESDFHKANIRAVAKKAGVSFSTIYTHYGSKERLLFAFVDIWLAELTERIIDHLQGIEDLKEKLRKVFWVQLDYYERNPGLGRILFMTLPMKTWMADETFQQKKMVNMFLDVLRQGQREGVLNSEVRTGVLLDFILGLVQRSFFMWIARGQKESLSSGSNILFNMVWRAISNPDRN